MGGNGRAVFQGGGRRWVLAAGMIVVAAACGSGSDGHRVATGTTEKPPTQVLGNVIERELPVATSPTVAAPPAEVVADPPQPPASRAVVSTTAPAPTPTTEAPTSSSSSSPSSSTTTVTTCHPDDADCDGWWWTTAPGPNGPILLEVTISPANPVDGDELTVRVRASDPDAQVGEPFLCFRSEDGSYARGYVADRPLGAQGCLIAPSCVERQEGPVEPPAPTPSQGEWRIHHTFPGPGSYVIDVSVGSSTRRCGPDPYASEAAESHPVVVSASQ